MSRVKDRVTRIDNKQINSDRMLHFDEGCFKGFLIENVDDDRYIVLFTTFGEFITLYEERMADNFINLLKKRK